MTDRRRGLSRRRFLAGSFAATAAVGLPGRARAAAPDKLHFLIPGGAGGGWDDTARTVGRVLTDSGLLRNASYQNIVGPGGTRGVAQLIEAAARYQEALLVHSAPLVIGGLRYQNVPTYRDITPIAAVIGDYHAFAVPNISLLKTWQKIAFTHEKDQKWVKVAGGSISGSWDHLVLMWAFEKAGQNASTVTYVPYDGGGRARLSMLNRETRLLSSGLGEILPHVRSGALHLVGVASPARVADAPEAQTMLEQGYDVQAMNWRGFFGPPGLPKATAQAYADLLRRMYETPQWKTARAERGWVDMFMGPDQFAAFLKGQEGAMQGLFRNAGRGAQS